MNPPALLFRRYWLPFVFGLLTLAVIALRFAQPIADGDVFWHMAYASQMLERGTLRPDPSLYSWTPAVSGSTVYCAWGGELLLLGLWKCWGLAGLHGLRYASVLAVLGLLVWQAGRQGLLRRPEAWLVMLVSILAAVVTTYPKPEILSFVLWNGLVFCWFSALHFSGEKRNALPWIYAMPCLLVLWVNIHGGFMLAAPFVALAAGGGFWLFPKREARHLLVAAGLCLLATLATPYGFSYVVYLVRLGTGRSLNMTDPEWNNALQRTWTANGQFYHLPEFLVWMTVGFVLASLCRRRGWPVLGLLFLAYIPLDLLYVRSSFLLPALFGHGVLHLVRESTPRRWLTATACVLFVFFSGRAVYETKYRPDTNTWLGFGISYDQPVAETEFLARGQYGHKIINTYNAGGYLLWRLFPQYQVMVDARSFPYLGWFHELYRFQRTEDPVEFRAFLERHPGDVALVDFKEELVWRNFLVIPGWKPAFYGPSAVVFVRTDGGNIPLVAASGLGCLRNADTALRVFMFARAVGDYRTAWSLLDQMRGPLRRETEAAQLEPLLAYREGHAALRAHAYARAWDCFERSFAHYPIIGRDKMIMLLLRALTKTPGPDPQQAVLLQSGLARLQASE